MNEGWVSSAKRHEANSAKDQTLVTVYLLPQEPCFWFWNGVCFSSSLNYMSYMGTEKSNAPTSTLYHGNERFFSHVVLNHFSCARKIVLSNHSCNKLKIEEREGCVEGVYLVVCCLNCLVLLTTT